MPTTTTLTTELDAVNICLDCIGEAPVSSTASSGLEDVAKALSAINEVSREVQQGDYDFNSEVNYPLIRAIDNTITAPANTLEVLETSPSSDIQITLRGLRVYDKKNHTYTFAKDLLVSIKLLLDWAELPQAARNYIAIRAARRFQARNFGSETKHKFAESDEMSALVNLKATEGITAHHNFITDSYSVYQIIER